MLLPLAPAAVVTNTASWLTTPGYAKTLLGWWQALSVGLPGYPPTWLFFRNAMVSDAGFTLAFLGCLVLVRKAKPVAGVPASEPRSLMTHDC